MRIEPIHSARRNKSGGLFLSGEAASRRSCGRCHGCLILLLALAVGSWLWGQTNVSPSTPTSAQIIAFLNHTLDWHRQVAVQEQLVSSPGDTLFVADSKQLDTQVIRKSFDFARAAAPLVGNDSSAVRSDEQRAGKFQHLQQLAATAEAEVQQTQSEIDSTRAKLKTASPRSRKALRAQADALQSELALDQTRSETLRALLEFSSGAGAAAGGGNLLAQINELQRSVPESAQPATGGQSSLAAASGAAAGAASARITPQAQPTGILSLVENLFSLKRKIGALNQAVVATDSLSQAGQQLRAPIIASMNKAEQQGETLAKEADTATPAQLEELKKELDQLTTTFKRLTEVVVPLGEQSVLLGSYKSNLLRWRDAVRGQYGLDLKELAIRLAFFAGIILVVLTLAELWQRAIFRYVHDVKRRYQFLLLRRILLWCVIGIIVAFALASEIGSIATFAGLITAGIAVALQNVILAIAGYFFLIGKYGVRVGDRVQISGVTGDVVDIGLIRLHLMEIGGSGSDRHPSGRVVVFSNAVVFQPTASFFKQIPGTNFVWHEVSLMLAPESDYGAAEQRIVGAVETVYRQYHEKIELQYRRMEETVNMSIPTPQPHSRLRLTQSGLEVVVRYPVEIDQAAEIDDKVTRELLHALEQPPRLRLVGSGTPNIQPVPVPNGSGTGEPVTH